MLRFPNSKQREGFTLVEILVVIAIIAILVALTAPALMRVFSRGAETQNAVAINDLDLALHEFKKRYGTFPPSKIRLCPRRNMYFPAISALDAHSLGVIEQIWPKISDPRSPFMATGAGQGIDWSGTSGQGPYVRSNGVVLEGDQCLVFFLGGIPTGPWRAGQPEGCMGFSTNPLDPSAVFATATNPTPEKVIPFFEFKANRLFARGGVQNGPNQPPGPAGGAGPIFWSYRDAHSDPKTPVPYVYFSSARRTNGYNGLYNPLGLNPPTPGTSGQLELLNDCASLGVWPWAEFMAPVGGPPPAELPRYYKPDTFQIISAGADGMFGTGTMVLRLDNFPFNNPTRTPRGAPTLSEKTGLVGAPVNFIFTDFKPAITTPPPSGTIQITITVVPPPGTVSVTVYQLGWLGSKHRTGELTTWGGVGFPNTFWNDYWPRNAWTDDQTNFHSGRLGARAN